MRKQEREFNRKKEYARRCRIQVRAVPGRALSPNSSWAARPDVPS